MKPAVNFALILLLGAAPAFSQGLSYENDLPVFAPISDSDIVRVIKNGSSGKALASEVRKITADKITNASNAGRSWITTQSPGTTVFPMLAGNSVVYLDAAAFLSAIGGSSPSIRELDGAPNMAFSILEVTDGTLSDMGGGVARLEIGSGGGGDGDLLAANNLSDLSNVASARTNLQLNIPSGWLATDKLVTVAAPIASWSDVWIDSGSALGVRISPSGSASDVSINLIPKGTGEAQLAESGLNYGFLVSSSGMQFTYAGASYLVTPAGLTLLNDADAAAQRVTLGVALDASGFNGNLATTDDTIQEVAQKLDDLATGGGGGGDATLSGTQTFTGAKTFSAPITLGQNLVMPTEPMGALAINTSEPYNSVSISAPTTLTFNVQPAAGAMFGVQVENSDTSSHILTIPSTRSEGLGVARTQLLIQPTNGVPYTIQFRHEGSGVYSMRGDPVDYTDYATDIPVSADLLIFQQAASGSYRATSLTDLVSSVSGDSVLVNGSATADPSGVDLLDSSDIIWTLTTGVSPDTLSASLPATVDLDAKTAVLVPTVAAATNTTAAASTAMVQARFAAWVTEAATLQSKDLTFANNTLPNRIQVACSDMTTAITATGNRAYFRAPHAMTVTAVRASAFTAPTGAAIIIDVEEGGTSILDANRVQIDATEKTSTTAANATVVSDTSIADDAEITIDFDQVGSTVAGAGIIVTIYYNY